jgi:propionate CoA-transferase
MTLFYAAAIGNKDGSGADHFAHEGMLKAVIGGHYNMAPNLGKLIIANKLEGYNLPQGTLSQLYRDIAGHKVGTITHVGLNTFADPRIEGGKRNSKTTEDIVELVNVGGQERLWYKPLKFDVGFIRGTYADEQGNITLEREVCALEVTSVAQAVKNTGGKLIVQVEKVVTNGSLDPKLVKVPGIYVDYIVVAIIYSEHQQCQGCAYDGAMTGDFRVPLSSLAFPPSLSQKDYRGRRGRDGTKPTPS